MLNSKALAASASATRTYVEDVFSTWLYTGNGSTQTITNGIDLAGEGGLVWLKPRSLADEHLLYDTARGVGSTIKSNSNQAAGTYNPATYDIKSFNVDGFTLGEPWNNINNSSHTFASWTFRKAEKFFDVVTYTGNGSDQTISHNLGSTPGCIIVKRLSTSGSWYVYHRSIANATENWIRLEEGNAASLWAGQDLWGPPTATTFKVDTDIALSDNGTTYVAYLFAHDAGGFGDDGTESVIKCGSFSTDGSGNATVDLGWEPQWGLFKRSDSTASWIIQDTMRGAPVDGAGAFLSPNLSDAEGTYGAGLGYICPTPTGFAVKGLGVAGTFIYIAIRRGPMKTPEDATKVFQPKLYTGTNVDNRLVTTDIVTDMAWVRQRNSTTNVGMVVGDRMRGQPYLLTGTTDAEVSDADSFDREFVSTTEYGTAFSSMTGFWVGNDNTSQLNTSTTSNNHVAHAFRRAPGFFDVVAYTGTGSARTVSHNLGVVPELMIVKSRSTVHGWPIYVASLGATDYMFLNSDGATNAATSYWNDTSPTATVFTVETNARTNASSTAYIAYLFATCPGVSKVGSYTGTGTTLNVDCGFTAGARFVLIKRTDSTGDWYVWDTARGIVSADDPYLLLNSTAAEVTNTDYIDPLSSGFQISSTAPAAINANGGSFVFLAIS